MNTKYKLIVLIFVVVCLLLATISCGGSLATEKNGEDISELLQGTWTRQGPSTYIDIKFMDGSFKVELNWNNGNNITTIDGTYTINESESEILMVQSSGIEYGTYRYVMVEGRIVEIGSESGDIYTRK